MCFLLQLRHFCLHLFEYLLNLNSCVLNSTRQMPWQIWQRICGNQICWDPIAFSQNEPICGIQRNRTGDISRDMIFCFLIFGCVWKWRILSCANRRPFLEGTFYKHWIYVDLMYMTYHIYIYTHTCLSIHDYTGSSISRHTRPLKIPNAGPWHSFVNVLPFNLAKTV